MHCCGVSSYADWYDISSWPGERWVPSSCCRPSYNRTFDMSLVEGSGTDVLDTTSTSLAYDCGKSMNPSIWWDKGCGEAFQLWLVQRLHVVGSIGLVIAFLQVFQYFFIIIIVIQLLLC